MYVNLKMMLSDRRFQRLLLCTSRFNKNDYKCRFQDHKLFANRREVVSTDQLGNQGILKKVQGGNFPAILSFHLPSLISIKSLNIEALQVWFDV